MTTLAPAPSAAPPDLVPDDHVIVLFGATGDLARRKLLPGLFHLADVGLLPERYRVIGTSRARMTTEEFRAHARAAVDEFGRRARTDEAWERFAGNLDYAASDELAGAVAAAEDAVGGEPRRIYYLSVPPGAMGGIVEGLAAEGLAERARIVLEKPFGTDLASARALNETLHGVFDESQIFRIDHFLGKEAVQNILALRFANGLFEPVWNRAHIDHVQIDVPETLSIGSRAAFYEQTGAFRDMVVTHLFQVLGFVAMEPPTSLEAKALVDEKVKVFQALRPIDPAHVVRGQYDGYLGEDGVAAGSDTETFVALRVEIDNWRWAGVPFFLRTGKRLAEGRRSLTLGFREPPRAMFPDADGFAANTVTFDLGEPGSITARFLAKEPGATLRLGRAELTFRYEDSFCVERQLEAYERLIHDALLGDRTLFTRADGIERLWEVAQPLLDAPPPVEPYAPGSWGPHSADGLLAPRRWQLPEEA